MESINPIDFLKSKQQAERNFEEKEKRIYGDMLASDAREAFAQLPAFIADRGYADCGLVNWNGDDYAVYSLRYSDNDSNSRGLNVILLFNSEGEHVFIEGCSPKRGVYEGGRVLDYNDDAFRDYVVRQQGPTYETLAKLSFLYESSGNEVDFTSNEIAYRGIDLYVAHSSRLREAMTRDDEQ